MDKGMRSYRWQSKPQRRRRLSVLVLALVVFVLNCVLAAYSASSSRLLDGSEHLIPLGPYALTIARVPQYIRILVCADWTAETCHRLVPGVYLYIPVE
jgi:hypothetical protein